MLKEFLHIIDIIIIIIYTIYYIILYRIVTYRVMSTAVEQVVACACHAAGPGSNPGRNKFPG